MAIPTRSSSHRAARILPAMVVAVGALALAAHAYPAFPGLRGFVQHFASLKEVMHGRDSGALEAATAATAVTRLRYPVPRPDFEAGALAGEGVTRRDACAATPAGPASASVAAGEQLHIVWQHPLKPESGRSVVPRGAPAGLVESTLRCANSVSHQAHRIGWRKAGVALDVPADARGDCTLEWSITTPIPGHGFGLSLACADVHVRPSGKPQSVFLHRRSPVPNNSNVRGGQQLQQNQIGRSSEQLRSSNTQVNAAQGTMVVIVAQNIQGRLNAVGQNVGGSSAGRGSSQASGEGRVIVIANPDSLTRAIGGGGSTNNGQQQRGNTEGRQQPPPSNNTGRTGSDGKKAEAGKEPGKEAGKTTGGGAEAGKKTEAGKNQQQTPPPPPPPTTSPGAGAGAAAAAPLDEQGNPMECVEFIDSPSPQDLQRAPLGLLAPLDEAGNPFECADP